MWREWNEAEAADAAVLNALSPIEVTDGEPRIPGSVDLKFQFIL